MDERQHVGRQNLAILIRRLRPFIRPHRGLYLGAILLSLLTLGTALAFPQLMRVVIDEGIQTGDMKAVSYWITAMSCLLGIQVIATYFRTYLLTLGSGRVTATVRSWLFGQIVQHELSFFDEEDSGALTARLTGDVSSLNGVLGYLVPDVLQSLLRFLVAAALMVYTSVALSAVVLVVGPALWLGSSILAKQIRTESGKIQTKTSSLLGNISETLKGIMTVRVYHQEERTIVKQETDARFVVDFSKRLMKIRALVDAYTNMFSEGAVILAVWVGAILITGNSLTPGALVTFILYAGIVTRAASSLSNVGAELLQAQGATNRIFELGERESKMPYVHGEIPDSASGDLELEDVHFSYPSRSESAAVHGVDLSIAGGEEIALVGISGCGKSTIAKLISKLYAPNRGTIRLDGCDLRELDTEWLRESITLVPAEPIIFSRSVADNIRYGRPDATDDEVQAAALAAHAAEFIESLPDGYETQMGDSGRLFSSGQRQRIAIARAILRGPRVLVFDESTASLDTQSEAIVKEALRKLPQKPTLIWISHRLSTVADVPRLIVLNQGVIVTEGSHTELMTTSRFYQELVRDQLVTD